MSDADAAQRAPDGQPISHAPPGQRVETVDVLRETFPERVVTDPAQLAAASMDLSCEPSFPALAVVFPRTKADIAQLLELATEMRMPVAARGGGMSYTRAHVPVQPGVVLVDFRDMNQVVALQSQDRWVIAEPGCTWERLYMTTEAAGRRVPSWGPLSGRRSTVGGAVAQNGGFFGAAAAGTVLDAMLGLEVALPGGRLLRTGAWAVGGDPGTRIAGPDLTGVFCADSGAMGLKTGIALRLQPIPDYSGGTSFSCRDRRHALEVMTAIAAQGVASEVYAFDSLYHEFLASLGFPDISPALPWTVHASVEGDDLRAVGRSLDRVHSHVDARRIDGSVPVALRADPFGATQMIFSAAEPGVHLPIHALVSPSRADSVGQAIDDFLNQRRQRHDRFGIRSWGLMTAVGSNLLLECSLYFPGRYRDPTVHAPARAEAVKERRALVEVLDGYPGVTHFQIGKYYDIEGQMDRTSWSLLTDIKAMIDPDSILNPGALGLR